MGSKRSTPGAPARKVPSRVLLLVDASGDRRVLAAWLAEQHDVIAPADDDPFGQEFDLCVIDDLAFFRVWERIAERKRQSEPVFLPFVLLTSRSTAPLVSDVPVHDVDEVLEAPIAPEDLVSRVDVLLERRARERLLSDERERAMAALEKARRRTARELETTQRLLDAAHALNASIAPQRVLDSLVRILIDVTDHERVLVSLFQPGDGDLVVQAASIGSCYPLGTRLSLDAVAPAVRESLVSRHTSLVDYEAVGMPTAVRERSLIDDAHLGLSVPLVLGSQLIGHISIDQPGERREFSKREIQLADAVASQAAIAIENARLYQAELEASRLGDALAKVDSAIHSSLEFAEVAKRALSAGAEAIGAESSAIDGIVGDRWEVWYDYGFDPSAVGDRFDDEENPHAALAVRTGAPVAMDDAFTTREPTALSCAHTDCGRA